MLPGAIVVERVVPPGGFEPPISAFVARRPFQSDREGLVRPAGFEPAKARLEDELSIQRTRARGVPTGIRTLVSALRGRRPRPASRWGQSWAPGAGFEPAVGRLTGACVAASPPWYVSLSTDSNGPLPGTGRVRRHLRLRGSVRRSPDQVTADLQTCDPRSASAAFFPPPTKARASRRSVASRLIRPEPSGMTNQRSGAGDRVFKLQGSESNRQGPAYEAGSGANPPCRKTG
jgi:hypothetical protein